MSDLTMLHSTYARGTPEQIGTRHGSPIMSSLRKQPVPSNFVELGIYGLELDSQEDPRVHGGPEKALYAWPLENYQAWAQASGVDLLAQNAGFGGHFGENLLVYGGYAHERCVRIGDLWAWGDCQLMVTAPREPCYKLGAALPGAAAWMVQTGLCGWYLKLLGAPGLVPAYGARLRLLDIGNGVTIAEAFEDKMRRNDGRIHGQD